MYDYKKVFQDFKTILTTNTERANFKKGEYLNKIVSILKQFINKCEKQIDHIISIKIDKLYSNFEKVESYFQEHLSIDNEQKNLIIAEFLIKPFQRFPFAGNKNQKIFKEQYNLIEKASVLIQQTLIQSFKEDEVPTFENNKFFQTIQSHGIGKQSLTKLRLNPQNFAIKQISQIVPYQSRVTSLLKLNSETILCIGDNNFIEIWDILDKFCVKKFHIDVPAKISTATVIKHSKNSKLFVGFSDESPMIMCYRLDSWKNSVCNVTHTRQITKIIQINNQYIVSGSADGLICLHDISTLKSLVSCPHVSGIQDIFNKNSFIYILQKNSAVLEYQVCLTNNPSLNFRRSISAGYISIIRFPQLTTNFSGVGCHIYGLSQIEVTRKFKMEESNIINVPQMISDFIVLQSKQTSQYFALCVFQSSSIMRIYSLTTQQQVYEYSLDYSGEVGASGYLPKVQISWIDNKYVLIVVSQSEFEDEPNIIKCYQFFV